MDMFLSAHWMVIALALAAWADASAGEMPQVRIESRKLINDLPQPTGTAFEYALNLRIANIGDWNEAGIIARLRGAACILVQCRIRIANTELLHIAVAESHRHFDTLRSCELAHVLMDGGAHDNTPGNLMAEDTSPQNTHLTAVQCAQITTTGTRNGLLQSSVN